MLLKIPVITRHIEGVLLLAAYVRKIAIRTEDFKLSFHLMRELKRQNVNFVMLSPGENWEGICLTSPEEVNQGEIPVTEDTIDYAIERAIQLSRGIESAIQLVFGIDPGPRPGIAWLADGVLVGALQLEEVDDVEIKITQISKTIPYKRFCVKIGNGSPLVRDRLINIFIQKNIEVIQVNEHKTSKGSRLKAHINAATRIALQKGHIVHSVREIIATQGELKEIQRQSRIASKGEVTISIDLANKVAIGDLSLKDAISEHR